MNFPTKLASIIMLGSLAALGCNKGEVEDVAEGEAAEGATKMLTGEVVEVIDARTFTMKDEHKWLEDDLLTVVSTTNLPANFNDEDEVTVSGTVHNVPYAEIEREYDWDFDPKLEVEFEGLKGFFVADSVVVTEHEDPGL